MFGLDPLNQSEKEAVGTSRKAAYEVLDWKITIPRVLIDTLTEGIEVLQTVEDIRPLLLQLLVDRPSDDSLVRTQTDCEFQLLLCQMTKNPMPLLATRWSMAFTTTFR